MLPVEICARRNAHEQCHQSNADHCRDQPDRSAWRGFEPGPAGLPRSACAAGLALLDGSGELGCSAVGGLYAAARLLRGDPGGCQGAPGRQLPLISDLPPTSSPELLDSSGDSLFQMINKTRLCCRTDGFYKYVRPLGIHRYD